MSGKSTTPRDRTFGFGPLDLGLSPDDPFNRALVENVHPPDWINPTPGGRYNLVVIGAGTAGLVTAAIASSLGAKVALIERHLMGGDCLNVGCVPSKALLRAARAWEEIRRGGEFGAAASEGARFDFGAAMERMRRLRAEISRVDSARRYRERGVDVFIGEGRFAGPDHVEVDGKRLVFSKAVISTGARAAVPPIPGLKEAGYLTNETLFNLTRLPRSLAVIGGGPTGAEMAQAFRRFGAEVYLFEREERILPGEEADAAAILQERMKKEGVQFVFKSKVVRVEGRGGEKVVHADSREGVQAWAVEEILVSVGRAPNVEGLNLEAAGVAYDLTRGVQVNPRLQTMNRRIFAAGDICFPDRFTHAADALARIVVQNALFPHPLGLGWATTDSLIIPRIIYTSPEIAQVGISEADAKGKGIEIETFTAPMREVDRARLDGEEEGFARARVRAGTDAIVGATVVAARAGELIGQFTLAMKEKLGLSALSGAIFPYPTQSEVVKKVADAWRKTELTEGKKKILRRWFAWSR